MVKLLWRFFIFVLAGLGIAWLADRPGTITVDWLGREIHLSVLVGIVFLTVAFVALYILLRLFGAFVRTPTRLRKGARDRRTRKAYQALSRGIVAAGAGDHQAAARHAAVAAETLTSEPLVKLLGAQAAQLRGDRDEVRRVFNGMAQMPETELLGRRGLFADARDAGDWQAARQHAETALAKNPRLPWASAAVLQSLVAHKDWEAAARNVAQQGKVGLMGREEAARKQAALLTAQAQQVEDSTPSRALELAAAAHGLDPALVPAACVLARRHSDQGSARKALKVLRSTWAVAPHRDLATLAAKLHEDGSESEFERVRDLVGASPEHPEGIYALARAAVAAGRFDAAREVLTPALAQRPAAGICALMAEVADATGNGGESRHWLAEAVSAPRDPMWVSDGVASAQWVPVSPVTNEIVPCEWRVPFEQPIMPHLRLRAEASKVDTPVAAAAAIAVPRLPDDPGLE